ncbi:hypothetical protein M0813_09314 [Anaeramoeba flamelloides]|uniref:Reverse transcriptase zinc-binding domain-containing protein n=1 Tax=Anaeramoeba flamelloides TaxID=1746091 RepID=A0ABQ8X6T0_9EUKA|nr:hypothetical protein M0813_09314 [Anaeramoeba flamelloides]
MFNKFKTDKCLFCDTLIEDIPHMLWECPTYNEARLEWLKGSVGLEYLKFPKTQNKKTLKNNEKMKKKIVKIINQKTKEKNSYARIANINYKYIFKPTTKFLNNCFHTRAIGHDSIAAINN